MLVDVAPHIQIGHNLLGMRFFHILETIDKTDDLRYMQRMQIRTLGALAVVFLAATHCTSSDGNQVVDAGRDASGGGSATGGGSGNNGPTGGSSTAGNSGTGGQSGLPNDAAADACAQGICAQDAWVESDARTDAVAPVDASNEASQNDGAVDATLTDAGLDVKIRYSDATGFDDYRKYLGKYLVTVTSGGIMCGTAGPIRFSNELLEVKLGTDSNLVVTTNPLPTEYPAACSMKVNAEGGPTSGVTMAIPNTSCTSGGSTLEFGGTTQGHVYSMAFMEGGQLAITVNGVLKTGDSGDSGTCTFGYGGTAQPIE